MVNDSNKVVGLHFAGSTDGTSGVANQIQEVLTALNVSLCSKGIPKSHFKELVKIIRNSNLKSRSIRNGARN